MVHAVSPAVPPRATARVARAGGRRRLDACTVVGAGEFDDPRYRDNPADRCYFCKTNLYDRIRQRDRRNDRLRRQPRRPRRLPAGPARRRASARVVHPFVDAGMRQGRRAAAGPRSRAPRSRRAARATLPVEPRRDRHRHRPGRSRLHRCVEVSHRAARRRHRAALPDHPSRCGAADRTRPESDALVGLVKRMCADAGRPFAGLEPYRRGSMFVRP